MRILFVGTVKFSLDALQCIWQENAQIVGVITQSSSGNSSDFVKIKPFCQQNGIDCLETNNINTKEVKNWAKKRNPDVIFCFGWSQIIRKEFLSIAPMGVIGFHPAELPKNRGRHPLIWALFVGLEKTATSFFFMDEGADSGDLLSQKIVPIFYEDNARSLYDRVTSIALSQIKEFLVQLENQAFNRLRQEHSKANVWRKRDKSDGEIDFRMSINAIYNLVRSLSKPYVGAHLVYKGQDIKIWNSREVFLKPANIEPGRVMNIVDDGLIVTCYDNSLWLENSEFSELPVIGETI